MLSTLFSVLCFGALFTAASPTGNQHSTVRCAEIPNSVYQCLTSPKIVNHVVSTRSCDTIPLECDRVKCIFAGSGWIQNGFFNKTAMSDYFTQFAHDKPEWTQAVSVIKERCLKTMLLPQGIHMECPEYDTMHCILSAFIRKSNPSQWSSSAECESARSYAAVCPTCPTACFAPTIPAGSCNACLDWPKL